MPIQTIPGSARVQDAQIGVKASAQPRLQELGAARGAIKAAAGAIQDSVGAIADYEQKKRNAWEAAAFTQAGVVTQKATQAYTDGLRHINTEDGIKGIVPQWNQIASDTKTQLLANPDLSPNAKRRLQLHLDGWQGTTTAGFQSASDQKGATYRKMIAHSAAQEFLMTGDPEKVKNAEAAIDTAVRSGDMWPEEAAQTKAGFQRTLQENQIRNGMAANPWQTLQDIDAGKYKVVPSVQLSTLRRETDRALAMDQGLARDKLLGQVDDGIVIDESEIKRQEDQHTISPGGANSIRSRQKQADMGTAKESRDIQLMEATDHDWIGDKDPDVSAQKMKDEAAALPTGLRKQVYDHIDSMLSRSKKQGEIEEAPVHREQLELMKSVFQNQAGRISTDNAGRDAPKFVEGGASKVETMSDATFRETFGPKAKRSEVVERAKDYEEAQKLRYAKAQQQYRAWSQSPAGQKATPEEADQQRERLGFGRYETPQDVRAALQANSISRDTAKQILRDQFGGIVK